MEDKKLRIISVIIIGLGILAIIYFATNGELQNKLLRKTLLDQTECDGEAVTYSFNSNKDFIVYEQDIPIPAGYSPKTETFKECDEVRIYCGNKDDIINTKDGSPKIGIEPNLTFIANSNESKIVYCFSDSCVYEKVNSLEICK